MRRDRAPNIAWRPHERRAADRLRHRRRRINAQSAHQSFPIGGFAGVFGSAPELLQSKLPDVASCLVLDVRLPGLSGLDFQTELAMANIHVPIIFMTGHGDIPMTVRAMKAGAIDFLTKPFRQQEMLDAVAMAIERDRKRRKNAKVVSRAHGRPCVEPQVRGGLAAWQQRTVVAYVEDHLAEPISLATLAQLVRLSPYYFCRAFKQSFGMPPHRYHTGQRIERAKTLLAKSDPSVTDIGFAVGFSQTSSFTAAFRKATGLTPTAYHRSLS